VLYLSIPKINKEDFIMLPTFITIIVIVAVIVLWTISTQRRLVVLDENISNGMSQIRVQLSSRFDALTALLNLTKGYAKHESETLVEKIKSIKTRECSLYKPKENGGFIMKKLLALMMALILSLSLVACGGEKITLKSQTINGLTLNVPSDFGAFQDVAEQIKMAKNADSTATITISERVDAQKLTADFWDEKTFAENVLTGLGDLKILEFSNSKKIVGVPAVFAHYSGKNTEDVKTEGYIYLLYHNDGTYQSIVFSFTKDSDSSLTQNLTTIIDSMK
jgi:hypothetical protein